MTLVEGRGAGFRNLTKQIDTTDAGKSIFHPFRVLAEFERNLSRERTMTEPVTFRALVHDQAASCGIA